MNATPIIGVASTFLVLALAGCTGGFQVDQTEPFRIQLEGAPETVTVRESDTEAKRVVVETCDDDLDADSCDVDQVDVQLEVKQVSTGPCKILVTIQDEDGRTIVSRIIDVSAGSDDDDLDDDWDDDGTGTPTSSSATGTNGTTSATVSATSSPSTPSGGQSGQTVIQNIVVNVQGHKNIVVLTQAQQGTADINIQAIKASGNADVDADQGTTGSATMTATTPATNSTTNSTTSGP